MADQETPLGNPELNFDRPLEVLQHGELTREQKIEVLSRWRDDLQSRLRSTGEGMVPPSGQTADEAARITEITKALEQLGAVGQLNCTRRR